MEPKTKDTTYATQNIRHTEHMLHRTYATQNIRYTEHTLHITYATHNLCYTHLKGKYIAQRKTKLADALK